MPAYCNTHVHLAPQTVSLNVRPPALWKSLCCTVKHGKGGFSSSDANLACLSVGAQTWFFPVVVMVMVMLLLLPVLVLENADETRGRYAQ